MKATELKFLSLIASFMLLVASPVLRAQPWSLPLSPEIDALVIENQDKDPVTVWLTGPVDADLQEKEKPIEISGLQKIIVDISQETSRPWVQLKSYRHLNLKVFARTVRNTLVPVPEGRAQVREARLNNSQGLLVIANQSPIDQDGVILRSTSQRGQESLPFRIKGFENIRIPLFVEAGDRIQVQASYALTATWISQDKSEFQVLPPAETIQRWPRTSTKSYFLLTNNNGDQSFVFSSSDPDLIMKARMQIRQPAAALPRILVGRIQLGDGNENRDWRNPWKTAWSWSVSQAIRFADFGSQDCDGSPQLVEDLLLPWIQSGQTICFWGYRVVREITTSEL